MSARFARSWGRWPLRLAVAALSALGASMPALASDLGLLPRHPRVADAQLVVPAPRVAASEVVRPPMASIEPHPHEAGESTSAPASALTAPAPVPVPVPAPAPTQRALAMPTPQTLPFDSVVQRAAQVASVDAALLHAIIDTESGYDPQAVSVRGAIGLMQVLPRTGERFGVRRLEDPAENVRAGASYIRWLLSRFDDDLTLALAAYNAGEGAVLRYGRRVPPFPETQNYVRKVMAGYARLRDANARPAPVMADAESPAGSTLAAERRDVASVPERTRTHRKAERSAAALPVTPVAQDVANAVETTLPANHRAVRARTKVHAEASTAAAQTDEAPADRTWRLLKGLGTLLTRSPSTEAAGAWGRDRPAVVMPSRGRDRHVGPAAGS